MCWYDARLGQAMKVLGCRVPVLEGTGFWGPCVGMYWALGSLCLEVLGFGSLCREGLGFGFPVSGGTGFWGPCFGRYWGRVSLCWKVLG
jgi:hypothetical protein